LRGEATSGVAHTLFAPVGSGTRHFGEALRRGCTASLTLNLLLQVTHFAHQLVDLAIQLVDLLHESSASGTRANFGAAARCGATGPRKPTSRSGKSATWRGPLFAGRAFGPARNIRTWIVGLSRPVEESG
jgi:hypothetical protein